MRESGRPIAHIAEDLGIHCEALRLWVRQDEADRAEREDRLSSDEREELIHHRAWKTRTDVEIQVAAQVGWYNRHRVHRAIGDIPPAECEINHCASIKAPAHDRS